MSIPGLDWLNAQPWTRPALLILTTIAVVTQQLAPPHTVAFLLAGKVLALLAPLVAVSAGKSHDLAKPSPAAVDAALAARGGPLGVLRGSKDE
ncbi:MAG: hypothetical protein ABT940_10890 [Alphaproteobacteria bacterium]